MTSDIVNMVIGAAISAVIGSGISFLFWAGVQRKVEQRDKQLEDLKGTVRVLKDEKVASIETDLKSAVKDNHEKHGGLHTKIENTAKDLHEKLNKFDREAPDRFVTRRECVSNHDSIGREMGQLRKALSGVQASMGEVEKTANETAVITRLIADKLDISLPGKK